MIKFDLNKEAFISLAKELRMASWGVSVITATIVFNKDSSLSVIMGALSWIVLQTLGFFVASIQISKKE